MRTTIISPASYKFLAALAVIAMVLAALPVMPAYAASITVTNVNDDLTNGNGCSLREAIINSNNNSATHADCAAGSSVAADVITLTGGQTYTLSLTGASSPQTGDLDLTDPAGLTITSSNTTSAKIDANDIDRVFDIAAGAGNVTFNYLTITNGSPADGLTGGGINFGSTSGTLNITNSTVSSNTAPSTTGCGAGLFTNSIGTVNITNSTFEDNSCTVPLGDGGGIYKGSSSTGTLNISGSTFSGNIASDNGGAAQFSAGTVNITNSTFHFNTAGGRGGAIQVGGATVTIEFSTFSTNADNGGGVNAAGAVQVNSGTVAINRSILANSTAGKDCDQLSPGVATITNSLVEINSDCGGTITSNADPDLGALASNGGPTQTMAIDNTSPAYNAAASCNSIATDQRGVARPQATLCDLGAFEFVDTGLPTVVSIMRASPNPIASASVNYTVTFSESVKSVGVSDFSLNLSGSVTGASVTNVSPAGPTDTYTVTIYTGFGSGTIRLDIPTTASIFDVSNNPLTGLPFQGEVYNKVAAVPAATTLVSPDGTISDTTPTYTWDAVFNAEWYYLWVNAPSGTGFIKQWFTAAQAGCPFGTGTCSATPTTVLQEGSHTWWIRTWNQTGYGPWSGELNFQVDLPSVPGATTLISPDGTISDTTPEYTWDAVSGAEWYYLWVNAPSGTGFIKQWFSAAQAGCAAGTGTCSATPTTALALGAHTFWVQTWNTGGYGPWSGAMNFNVTTPGQATLVSPNANTTDTTPEYTWNAVSGAEWYYLWVNAPSGTGFIKQWFTAAQAGCAAGTGTCSATPTTELALGAHTFFVRTWSSVGYGPWSADLDFTVVP